jgi:hypothetical protein
MRPHILRTHDSGKTWVEIVNGIPDGAPVDVVREDPKRKGLLYAGTERQVYVSFDDGDHWQSLRLNMPATSIRDLIIKDDDVVVATHSRGFWILDDVTPLRQLAPAIADAEAFLFQPETAIRVRWDMNTDTPLPPDEPAGQNPPDGAILDYTLGPSASGTVTLEISDSAGKLVRRYSSDDRAEPVDLNTLAIPAYWVRPVHALSNAPGMHRFLWDMRYTPVREGRGNYGMQAIYHDTPASNEAPWVNPGTYTAKLTVNGKSYTQPLTVKMDPRVKTSSADLTQQFTLSKQLYDDILVASKCIEEAAALRKKIDSGAKTDASDALDKKIAAIAGGGGGGRGGGGRFAPGGGPDTLASVQGALSNLLRLAQGADVAPTPQVVAAAEDRRKALASLLERWRALKQETPELRP